jgi:Dyp-type peroxidase family
MLVPAPVAPAEPVLATTDIQGLIVPGFNKPHQTLVGVRFPSTPDGRAACRTLMKELSHEVTTAAAALNDRALFRRERQLQRSVRVKRERNMVCLAIGFSAKGLAALTPGARSISSPAFQTNLAARSKLLGDPTDPKDEGHPNQWIIGGPDNEPDALLVLAGDERQDVDALLITLLPRLARAGMTVLYNENGDIREDLPGHEHFGFDDGVSQPGVRGLTSSQPDSYLTPRYLDPQVVPDCWLYGLPGQNLVWPGEFVFGYPRTSPDPLIPGPTATLAPDWTRNGSFLVFRRLRQDVGLFWRTMREEAKRLSRLPGFENMTDERLAALMVGRWPSGAPVNRTPEADNAVLGKDRYANNHFRFDSDTEPVKLRGGIEDSYPQAKADPAGITCPWAAHIRKVNVRDSGTDMGGGDASTRRRILRRGITFGKPLEDRYAEESDSARGQRGLLFLSVQTSIEEQFEFLQTRWMNDPTRPKMPGGHDILIGQNGQPQEKGVRRCTLFGSGLQTGVVETDAKWVIPTGGGYFFLPSVSALREVLGG